MSNATERLIAERLGRMSIEEKAGQLFVFSLLGMGVAPDTAARVIGMNCSGLRISQNARVFRRYSRPKTGEIEGKYRVPRGQDRDFVDGPTPYLAPGAYAELLNRVKRMGLERPSGIPLHFVLDQEGDVSADFVKGGVRFFPSQMGLAASGDTGLCERAAGAVARQLRAVGATMIHSPVLDVNTDPRNPEIGARAFSADPDTCARFGVAMLRGFQAHGLIATGKHFPGRGASSEDAHFDLPVIPLSRAELMDVHVAPYRALIAAGLPAIMIAHTAYPALDPSGRIATVSRPIVTGLLREELGFEGVITTDSISMGALVKQCGDIPEACVQSVEAGADLVLLKDDDWIAEAAWRRMIEALRSGRIPEARADASIRRTLHMKAAMGLLDGGDVVDPARIERLLASTELDAVTEEAARRACVLLRDRDTRLPLRRDQRILLVAQTPTLGRHANDAFCHCGMMWDAVLKFAPDTAMTTEVNLIPTEEDRSRVLDRLDQADVLVVTNDYARGHGMGAHTEFIREILRRGKPVVVVTNSPYPVTAPEDFPTVLCTLGSTPAGWAHAARVLFGEAAAEGRLP